MAYTGAEFSLGLVEGFNRRRHEQQAQQQAQEDRRRRMAWEDEQRARQREQWRQEDAARSFDLERRRQELTAMRTKAEREGALDFLYDLDSGDIDSAVRRYNARGTSKIDPRSVRVEGRRVWFTHSDTDGDGQPESIHGDLDELIARAERALGREPRKRYTNVPEGGMLFDERTGRVVAENPKDARPVAVRADQALVDPATRQPTYTGPQYGRPKPSVGSAGRKPTPFNPETYNRDLQKSFDALFADQTDPKFRERSLPFTQLAFQEARRLNAQMPGQIAPQEIARAVATAVYSFDESQVRKDARERALAEAENSETSWVGDMFDLNKPDPKALRMIEDNAVAAARATALGNLRVQLSYLEQDAAAQRAAAESDDIVDAEILGETNARGAPARRAPPAAIEYLRAHPELREQFRQKYGYVPPGL
ncbi:MAG: hypothetical protein IRZ28_13215 [Steroidobacteraceae bacterium]|nr:hypothetical protein [Steroidobacteraceae bacterium]